MNAERSSSGFWLFPVLVGLGAAAAGIGAGWFLRGGQAAAAPVTVQAAGGVTREELEALKHEILLQLQLLARPQSTATSPAAAPAADQVFELGRRLDDLDARIAVLSSGVRPGLGGRAWANTRGRGSESIEKIGARIQANHALELKDEPHEDMETVLQREHFLWMTEDVVRAYGPPEHIETSNGLAFYYGRFRLEGTEEPCFVFFRMVEGFVTDVGYDCRNGW